MDSGLAHKIIRFLFTKLNTPITKMYPEEYGWTRIESYKDKISLSISKNIVAFVSGEEEFEFEHLYDVKTGKFLGTQEEFSVGFDPNKHYWFTCDSDSYDDAGYNLYYVNGNNITHIKRWDSGRNVFFKNMYRDAKDPEKILVQWFEDGGLGEKEIWRWFLPNGKTMKVKRKDKK